MMQAAARAPLALEPFVAAAPVAPAIFEDIRLALMLEDCKWDPQYGDVSTLSPQPIVLRRAAWSELAAAAEALAHEGLAAEVELARRPDLVERLGLPRAIRRELARTAERGLTPGLARVVRFDFHWTTEGWRISEANSDVPGGFIEAADFARRMADAVPGTQPPGDPARAVALALDHAAEPGPIALVHATSFADDHQVMRRLARELASRCLEPLLVAPDHLEWRQGRAHVRGTRLGAILRFYPGEWLPQLPRDSGWENFVAGGLTRVSNPARALTWQSKRFPLAWPDLETPLPTWRALLPETRDPRAVKLDAGWVLKPALGRVGEDIVMSGVTAPKAERNLRRRARWFPSDWAAQRRFEAIPAPRADAGGGAEPRWPCVGVFVVNGRACGAYGRVATRPLIDATSRDAAVLVEAE